QPERNAAAALLFQVFFELDNVRPAAPALPGLAVELLPGGRHTATPDLALYSERQGAGLGAELKYAADLYDRTTIERLIAHFLTLLARAAEEADTARVS